MPTSIPESAGVWAAIENVSAAMRGNLEASLAEVVASITADPLVVSRLAVPAPSAADYHYSLSRAAIDRIIKNSAVAVFISQAKPSVEVQRRSLIPPNNQDISQLTYIEVSLVYRLKNGQPFDMFGKTFTTADMMSLRGYVYAGAIMDCVRKFGASGDNVSLVETKDSDFAGAVRFSPDGEPLIGAATVTWGLRQDLSVPLCQ